MPNNEGLRRRNTNALRKGVSELKNEGLEEEKCQRSVADSLLELVKLSRSNTNGIGLQNSNPMQNWS